MRPLTFSTNKHFISLANKPLLYYAIEEVSEAGIKEIGINYNPGQLEEIKSHLGRGERWGVNLSYILQKKPKGLANIVEVSKDFIGQDKFVMHLGDNIFYGGIRALVEEFTASKANGLLTIIHHPENVRMGVPYFDDSGRVVKLVEKPQNPPHDWAIPGVYFADEHIFECFEGKEAIKPSTRGEYEIPAAFQWLIDHGYEVRTKEFTGTWLDPGKFDDWIATNQFLLDHCLKSQNKPASFGKDVQVEGLVQIGKNCRIKNSRLIGPSLIGNNVTIEDSEIGPYCSVNDGSEVIGSKIENTILEKKVRVLRLGKTLNGSLIGEGTVIEGNGKNKEGMEVFLGNQCQLKL